MKPEIYILKKENLEVHISTLCATIVKMIITNPKGKSIDVVLGMESSEDYESSEYIASDAYLGSIVGRYANRIAEDNFGSICLIMLLSLLHY